MAQQRLAPDALLESTKLTGSVGNIQDDPDSPDGNWLVATANNVNTVARASFGTPTNPPSSGTGLQEFRALVRKHTSNSGTPTAVIQLYENGVLIAASSSFNVTSTGGQVISYTWDAASLSAADGSLVECRVSTTAVGSSPSTRNSVDIGAIEWNAETTPPPVDLVIQDGGHGHSSDGIGFTTASALAVQEGSHAHAADNATLVTESTLAIADAANDHVADNLTLAPASSADLVIAEAAHAHGAEAPTFTAASTLAVQESAHGHLADNLGLTADTWLAIAEAAHDHAAEQPELSSATALQPADATHSHAAENATLSTDSLLAVADVAHAHAADALVLDTAATTPLVVADAAHGHAAESQVFTTDSTLAVSEAAHAHVAEAPALTTLSWLEVQEGAHAQAAEQITVSSEVALAIAEALHGHAADGVLLNIDAAWLATQPRTGTAAQDAARQTSEQDGRRPVQASAARAQTRGSIRVNTQSSRRTPEFSRCRRQSAATQC